MAFALMRKNANSHTALTSYARTSSPTLNTKPRSAEFTCKRDIVCTGKDATLFTNMWNALERQRAKMPGGSR